jgi:hypothetical protein
LLFPKQKVGDANRAEYITAFSQRKLLLASLFFSFSSLHPVSRPKLFPLIPQSRIDEFFCFE